MGLSNVFFVILPAILGVFLIRKYRVHKWGRCRSRRSMKGQICIVTGANSGIGKEVAMDLARRGATVIMACRNLVSTSQTIEEIREKVHIGELVPMYLDLGSLESVRKFAERILQDYPQINLLVNNAGVYYKESGHKTEDGFEIHFGINHLGHFLLTKLLLPKLRESNPCRVVTVSSGLHERGVIDLENLNLDKTDGAAQGGGHMNRGYNNSKLANALFSQELATRAPEIHTYAVCPGLTNTGLFRQFNPRFYHYILFSPVILWSLRTVEQGAQTVIYCAVSEEVEQDTGGFYRNCQRYTSKADLNPQLANDLWEASERLLVSKTK